MTGANYMGGKRNAAKARQRDSTGRIQKGFFGRKKMELLTKSLANRAHEKDELRNGLSQNTVGTTPRRPVSVISLAHARAKLPEPVVEKETAEKAPSTPIRETKTVDPRSSTSITSRTSSKVIQALEIHEPLSRRAALDRILALPDLVGISCRKPQPEPRVEKRGADILIIDQPPMKRKRESPPEERTRSPLPPSSPQWSTSMSNSTWDHLPSEVDDPSLTYQSSPRRDPTQNLYESNDADANQVIASNIDIDIDHTNRTFYFSHDPAQDSEDLGEVEKVDSEGSMIHPILPIPVSSGSLKYEGSLGAKGLKISESGSKSGLASESHVSRSFSHGPRSRSVELEGQTVVGEEPQYDSYLEEYRSESPLSAEMSNTSCTLADGCEKYCDYTADQHGIVSSTVAAEDFGEYEGDWKVRDVSHMTENLFDHGDPWHSIGVILGLSSPSPRSPTAEEVVGAAHLEELDEDEEAEDVPDPEEQEEQEDPEFCYYDWPSEDPMEAMEELDSDDSPDNGCPLTEQGEVAVRADSIYIEEEHIETPKFDRSILDVHHTEEELVARTNYPKGCSPPYQHPPCGALRDLDEQPAQESFLSSVPQEAQRSARFSPKGPEPMSHIQSRIVSTTSESFPIDGMGVQETRHKRSPCPDRLEADPSAAMRISSTSAGYARPLPSTDSASSSIQHQHTTEHIPFTFDSGFTQSFSLFPEDSGLDFDDDD